MKIDRLIGITMYLLNRNVVSAKELADRFEVSTRTIARDMEALSKSGIPVTSSTGTFGGYEILDAFTLNKQVANVDDYLFIMMALKSLCSAYDNKKINNTLEKVLATGKFYDMRQRVFIDFSIAREGESIPEFVRELEAVIQKNRIITFNYTDSLGQQNHRTVEPIALSYKWYAWYLLAFCTYKNDYRLFKLSRITNMTVTINLIKRSHENIPSLLEKQWNGDTRKIYHINIFCQAEVRVAVCEYLKGKVTREYENGDFIYEMTVPENERMWFSLLLGFGNKIKIIEPKEIIDMLKENANEIQNLYKPL